MGCKEFKNIPQTCGIHAGSVGCIGLISSFKRDCHTVAIAYVATLEPHLLPCGKRAMLSQACVEFVPMI